MIKIKKIEEVLQSSKVLYNEPLRNYSFTKTGGNAEILVKINNEKDLQNVISYSSENNIKLTILGNGSNVLISDNGIQGIVALTSDMNNIELLEGEVISCYAGLTLKELTDFCI
ncbi:FAD-binding protein, partial [uncultured Gemella sp.]|uniref:FAD-binding protein n=1 Tax=uncultured Gemella sp. TaxID=254352 RepID=UPI0028D4664E